MGNHECRSNGVRTARLQFSSMSRQLRIALVVDPFRLQRTAGDHAPNVALELLGRGHLVRGFGSRGSIPRSGPGPELGGGGLEDGVGIMGFYPDVIVAYDPLSPAGLVAARAARKLEAPLLLIDEGHTESAGWIDRSKRYLGECLWGSWVRRRTSNVVALDGAALGMALESGFDPGRVTVLPSGVDLERYRPGLTTHILARHGVRGRVLLCTQKLEAESGLEELIRAFASSVGRRGDWSLVFAAEGPHRNRLRAEAFRLGIGGQVHWLGKPRREELPGLLGACTLYVAPCLDRDYTGWRLRRALAAGIPMIVEDGPRARTWVDDDASGLLVARGNGEAWTEALRLAVGSPERRRRWGTHARKVAEENFSWSSIGEQFESLLVAQVEASCREAQPAKQTQEAPAS